MIGDINSPWGMQTLISLVLRTVTYEHTSDFPKLKLALVIGSKIRKACTSKYSKY